MKTQRIVIQLVVIWVITVVSALELRAQSGEWYAGSEVVNRYIWRGVQYDNGVNIQPYVMYNIGGFEAGAAASTSFTNDFNEISLWTSYTASTNPVDITFYVGDFYYETGSADFWNFDGVKDGVSTGAHNLEGYISLAFNEIPISLLVSTVFWNDPDNSTYAQFSYYRELSGMDAAFHLGMALNKSDYWYYTEKAGLINASFEITREIEVTERFSIPLTGKTILNPYSETFYVVVGIGL